MRFVIAHELGHALSGHAVYQTLLLRLMSLTGVWNSIPGGFLGVRIIIAALYEWSRKSELSADRAGLLATQDPAVAFRVHMKLASGSGDLSELDQTSFFAQGQEYLDAADIRDSVLKILLIEHAAHPYAVVRAAELRRWVDSGDYTQVLAGTYPRRDEDGGASMSEAAKQAADSYTERSGTRRTRWASWSTTSRASSAAPSCWLDEQLRRTRD